NSAATTIDVLANDTTSPTGGTKNVVSTTQPGHGAATFTADGVSYTPASGFTGTDSFAYAVRNITAGDSSPTATATVTVIVVEPIVANADTAIVAPNAAATAIDVLANDTVTPAGGTKNVV